MHYIKWRSILGSIGTKEQETSLPPLELKAELEIFCFGNFRLRIRGQDVHISNKKAAELLAYLLWQGKPVKKQKLSEILWPDSAPRKAMDSLYKVCHYLQKFQDKAIPLVVQRDIVWMKMDSLYCDIKRFEEYYHGFPNIDCCIQAAALYEAPFLADEYYEWSEEAEAFYDIRYLEIIECLADHYDRNGNYRKADYYRRQLE